MGTAHTPAGGAKEVCPTCPCHCPASQGVSPKENIPGLSGTDPDIGWSPGQSRQRNEAKDVWGALGLHIGWELSLSLGLSGQGARLRGVMGTTHHVDLGQTDPGARWIQAEADVEPHARVQSSERNTWMACCWGAARAEAGGKRGQSGSLEMLPKSGGMSARVQVSPGLLEDCFQNNLREREVLPGEVPKDFEVIHVVELVQRGSPPSLPQRLIKLPGLSVEFRAVMLAHDHQDVAGWVLGWHRGCLQAPLRAVPLSVLQGGEETGILRGVHQGLQVIDATYQEEAFEVGRDSTLGPVGQEHHGGEVGPS